MTSRRVKYGNWINIASEVKQRMLRWLKHEQGLPKVALKWTQSEKRHPVERVEKDCDRRRKVKPEIEINWVAQDGLKKLYGCIMLER